MSEIELRSSHSSSEETTSDESDRVLVETSTPSSPTHPLSGEGDLDPTEGDFQLSVGTLPLTDKDPPKNPKDKGPPQEPPLKDSPLVHLKMIQEIRNQGISPLLRNQKQLVDSPFEYPPQDQPETPIDPTEDLEEPSYKGSQKVPIRDPFSRIWSGETADASNKDKKRHRWLTRKPKRRHSVELEILDGQDKRPYKYVLEGERDLLSRPRFYSRCPDANSIHLHMQNLY